MEIFIEILIVDFFLNFLAQSSKFLWPDINSPSVPDISGVFLKFPNFLRTLAVT